MRWAGRTGRPERTGRAVASVRTLPGARDPVELFRTLSGDSRPVLLQSARKEPGTGRYSIVASDPFLTLGFREGIGILRSLRREEVFEGDPFPVLREELDRFAVAPMPGIPFAGGAIGYLGYGLRRQIHPRTSGRCAASPLPDLALAFYDRAVVVDHERECTHLVATGFPERGSERRREKKRLDLTRLAERLVGMRARDTNGFGTAAPEPPVFHTPRENYLEAIRRAQEYISRGEIYQVNLSHRIRIDGRLDPLRTYRGLVDRHPGCFAACLPYGDYAVLCASPERLVRLEGTRAETRPIKGTRRRDKDPAGDVRSARELRTGIKERSENVMIVDLARNDLGSVCEAGSVVTEELCRVESLPSVHHLVSTVSGRLRQDRDRIDLVRALFPGGSMTGAPKIRAMEIIEELEGVERGIYSGSAGYFSFDGDLDLNIVIRTLVVSGGSALLQVGGAILAESDPEAEYQETLDKARPLLELLEKGGVR